jgi:hypothetical protein
MKPVARRRNSTDFHFARLKITEIAIVSSELGYVFYNTSGTC